MATSSPEKVAVNGIRTALGIGGVVALIVGILILVWPLKSAMVVAAMIAVYAIVAGLIYAGLGVFSKSMSGWARVGHIALGVVFVAAGIVAFSNLGMAVAGLGIFIGYVIAIMWIVEGVVSLTTLSGASSKGLTIFFAIISIIAGIFLLVSPIFLTGVLWLFIGISLVVLGILQIVRAFTFKSL
ncbi:uncharacterized membrane protein HdeD (DUF308 family) [Microbacterium endophyticum]|uniref:Uncharacterized membrane protein HdeD (DUF308 family) n=1 Tax=Microbacterium endophyticum TaxID=1526412 RepID=A0A7W4YPF5_9MICO|nr:DUF308 domain-containing protein [Microbacterium endophyticum]MBB2976721.1 uncharacterized membrane protein HdeD (DUF308 family) [Microbacterium endophyticum]NIK36643.1 uncharacterized membrane protein HdeD (DUF308 family) [Microbacterium endophyticum]